MHQQNGFVLPLLPAKMGSRLSILKTQMVIFISVNLSLFNESQKTFRKIISIYYLKEIMYYQYELRFFFFPTKRLKTS